MNHGLDISSIHIRLVENGTDGLIAWASCVVAHAIKLENIGVRLGNDGLFLTFPRKLAANGHYYPYFHPISEEAAEAVQNAVLARLAALAKAAASGGTPSH